MIIIPKAQLPFLLAGRTLTVSVPVRPKPYRAHRPYAVGLHHRSTVCHVEIINSETVDGAVELRVRLITIDRPRLLAARSEYGYTTNERDALPDEPEAIHGPELDEMAVANHERYRQTHASELRRREAKSLNNQLREAQARALSRGIDITPEMQAIREQLEQIRSKTEERAA